MIRQATLWEGTPEPTGLVDQIPIHLNLLGPGRNRAVDSDAIGMLSLGFPGPETARDNAVE